MLERRSLKLPITLGVLMIVVLVVLIVGWVLLTVFGVMRDVENAPVYWTLMPVGAVCIAFLLVGVSLYLTLSVKEINLNRRQSNFIDSVTHELKSPIASLKLYLQTLNRRHVDEAERQHFQQFMLEDVERLDELINHLLDAGRLAKQPAEGEEEEVCLQTILQGCAASMTIRYQLDEQAIQCDLFKGLVIARPVDVQLLFRNLVDNAVKYGGDPLKVEIAMKKSADQQRVVVSVADNGRGIPVGDRRRVFSRFVRLGEELEREQTGTGLGLFIVRMLVRRLHGRIDVKGRLDGPGTVFKVELPLGNTEVEASESTGKANDSSLAGEPSPVNSAI